MVLELFDSLSHPYNALRFLTTYASQSPAYLADFFCMVVSERGRELHLLSKSETSGWQLRKRKTQKYELDRKVFFREAVNI